ncbi:hypothetical protein ACFU8X_22685 [Brevibacillus porteri]|uniref:hypothetical protein n=1 Tax=Brevibacillus porteri TaxID=2126350 RepID=UPI00370B1B34
MSKWILGFWKIKPVPRNNAHTSKRNYDRLVSEFDEQGNGYRLISFSGNRTRDENGTIKMTGKLHLKLARPPKELNIVYKSQVKERKNVDWKIAIPLKQ